MYTDEEVIALMKGDKSGPGNSTDGRKAEILAYLRKLRKSDQPIASVNQIHKEMSFSKTKRQNTYSALQELLEDGKVLGFKNENGHWRFSVSEPKAKGGNQ